MALSIPVVKIVGGIIASGLAVSSALIIREMFTPSTKKAAETNVTEGGAEVDCNQEELEGEELGCCWGMLL